MSGEIVLKSRFKNPRFWIVVPYILVLLPLVPLMAAISTMRLSLYFLANKVELVERRLNSIMHKVTKVESLNDWVLKGDKSK